jgi:hypothetical protein
MYRVYEKNGGKFVLKRVKGATARLWKYQYQIQKVTRGHGHILFLPHFIYTSVLKIKKAVSWVVGDYQTIRRPVPWNTQFIFVSLLCVVGKQPLTLVPSSIRYQWTRTSRVVCGRSPTRIAGSNHAGGIDVCPWWVLCVFR